MKSVFVIGSINGDITLNVEHIVKPGETELVSDMDFSPGGKGLNQAVACARMGTPTYMVGSVGVDRIGDQISKELSGEQRLSFEYLNKVNDRETGQAFIQLDTSGENAILVLGGANSATTLDSCRKAIDAISPGDVVVFQLEIPLETVNSCLLATKKKGAFTILNAAPMRLGQINFSAVDLLIVNETEAHALIGEEKETGSSYAQEIYNRFGCDVVTTLGENGCEICTANLSAKVAASSVKVVDTTGAGDAFVGGLAHSLAAGQDLMNGTIFATELAAEVCQCLGAQGYTLDASLIAKKVSQRCER